MINRNEWKTEDQQKHTCFILFSFCLPLIKSDINFSHVAKLRAWNSIKSSHYTHITSMFSLMTYIGQRRNYMRTFMTQCFGSKALKCFHIIRPSWSKNIISRSKEWIKQQSKALLLHILNRQWAIFIKSTVTNQIIPVK